ncbi:MAG: FAD-dependent oxidoreductase [Alphaproteobacteria bacterium]|nr:FAD-dependent oxidoreductase [Alphaproteobacteria bacterium]MCW5739435.1 FAD-dependent oxidoreductase [Alphaproteobacteria bacterium]
MTGSAPAAHVPVAIIGGGLAGLYAARLLHAAGVGFRIIEARGRLGGRILSADASGRAGADGFDLGPSWFWPDLHLAMARVVAELGLAAFAQHDEGDALVERLPGRPPQRFAGFRQEPRSMRLVGGTGALVHALARGLPEDRIQLGARVTRISLEAARAVLAIRRDDGGDEILAADHVIAALPPRLIAATIAVEPDVAPAIRQRWRDTATWMAPHAKFFALYDRPFWREAGLSGMAQSMVGPLAEIHDATTASGAAALFGFIGVEFERRAAAGSAVLTRACLDQLARLFGETAGRPSATLLTDWTADPLTATAADRQGGAHPLPQHGPWITGAWRARLSLAGSETSATAPGYLAGALDAAQRAVAETLDRLDRRPPRTITGQR